MSQRPLLQSGNGPILYVQGLRLNYDASTGTISLVSPGKCRDQTNSNEIATTDTSLSVDMSITGAGGLDTGTPLSDTLYYVYIIADSTRNVDNPPVLIASKASTTLLANLQEPLYPLGYDMRFRLGAVRTDGLAAILPFTQREGVNGRVMVYNTPILLISAGNATVSTQQILTGYIPESSTLVTVKAVFTPLAAENEVVFSGDALVGTESFSVSGSVAAIKETGWGVITAGYPIGVPFYWKVSNAGDAVDVYLSSYNDMLINPQQV